MRKGGGKWKKMYCDVRKSSGSNFSVTDIKKLT